MRYFLLLLCTCFGTHIWAQQVYFQQEVNFSIDATLDDEDHIIRAFEKINYINHSSDTLHFLIFHVWPNAYKDDASAYCAHEVENGDTKFYYSTDNERGFIDSLSFSVNGQTVSYSNFNQYEDIIIVDLPFPLAPHDSVYIETPFKVVIPEVFSRLGHDEQHYQITQWYPKPAVYDQEGWHPLPYLDQGEFYSEFGWYDVHLHVPGNYVVAATGKQDTAVYAWEIASSKDSMLRLANPQYKTLHFTQNRIHDFAWFASKQYIVADTTIQLTTHPVRCRVYFKPVNEKIYKGSQHIIAQTIQSFSKYLGEYPYSQVSVVDGKLLAGGGMEYPMVTVIGDVSSAAMLQSVIVHEVGHNWFQGILGSNERAYPWMDEGLNSFYEKKIDAEITQQKTSKLDVQPQALQNFVATAETLFPYASSACIRQDQPIATAAPDFTAFNYGSIVYAKTPLLLQYLEQYIGADTFTLAMQQYYKAWQCKHPQPDDFKKIIQAATHKNIEWFFAEGLQTTHIADYGIQHVQWDPQLITVSVKNKGKFKGPIPVQLLDEKQTVLDTRWIEFPYQQKVVFTNSSTAHQVIIDKFQVTPDFNRTNNFYIHHRLLHRLRWKPGVGTAFSMSPSHQTFLLPAIGYNQPDGFMLGPLVHNIKIPNKQFQFALAPMYAWGSKQMNGTGIVAYTAYPSGKKINQIQFGIQGRSYHYKKSNLNITKNMFARYIAIHPFIDIYFTPSHARSTVTNVLQFNYIDISRQSFGYTLDSQDSLFKPYIKPYDRQKFGLICFRHEQKRTCNPFDYQLQVEGNHEAIKVGLTAQARIDYHKKNKSFYVRYYAGKFINFSADNQLFALRNRYLNSTYTADNDYLYQDNMPARDAQQGILSQQIALREGGFKVKTHLLANPIGTNNNWLMALNLRTDLPLPSRYKLQLFFDMATYAQAGKLNASGSKAIYAGGVCLHLCKEIISIYAPLIVSKDIKQYIQSNYSKNKFLQTITWSLDLKKIPILRSQQLLNQQLK